jgi:hypothetical protein
VKAEALIPNLSELLVSIEECKAQQRILSTLVLIYSGIDVVASLERQPGEGTKTAVLAARLGGNLVVECDCGNNHVRGRAAWCVCEAGLWRNGRFVSLPAVVAQ